MTQHYVLENFHAPFKSLTAQSRALIMIRRLRRIFSASKWRLNFQNPSTGSGDITSGARELFHFALKEKHKNGGRITF